MCDGVANLYTICARLIMGGWCFDGIESLYDCTDVFVAGASTVDSKTYVDLMIFTLFCC